MEITGIIIKKLSEREGVSKRTGSKWKTADFLFEVPGMYPRNIVFTVKDGQTGRVGYFEGMMGRTVVVSFGIDAHEHEGRWYNEVGAYGVRVYQAGGNERTDGQPSGTAETRPSENGGFGASDIGTSSQKLPFGDNKPPF